MSDTISRKDAINAIKNVSRPYVPTITNDIYCAVKAIEELPSAESCENTCEITRKSNASDLISREDTVKRMDEVWAHIKAVRRRNKPTNGETAVYLDMRGAVQTVPSAERKGKWACYDIGRFRRSECGKIQSGDRDSDLNFCCNCGSRNEVSEDE